MEDLEDLFMASNNGELSFLEADGNILLEQGSRAFITQPDQRQQNIYVPQVTEQLYIIQQVPLQNPDESQYMFGNVTSSQAPVTSILQGKSGSTVLQNIQTGSTSNAEYATQDVPVRHIVQVVQQPIMPVSDSHVLQFPVQQRQQILQHIGQDQIFYATIQKGHPDANGKVHIIRQPIQGIGSNSFVRFNNTPSGIQYAIQPARVPPSYMTQHPQGSVSVTHQQAQQHIQISSLPTHQNIQTSQANVQQSYQTSSQQVMQNIQTSSQPVMQNIHTSNQLVQQNMQTSSQSVQQNMQASSQSVQQNMQASSQSVQQNMQASSQSVQQNMQTSSQSAQQNMQTSSQSVQQNMQTSSQSVQQNMQSASKPFQQNMQASSQSVQQNCQTSSVKPEFPSSFQETFEKQQLQRAVITQSRGRGRKNNVSDRQRISQKMNEQNSKISQASMQSLAKQTQQRNSIQKSINISNVSPQQGQTCEPSSISAYVRCNSDSSYSLSIPENVAGAVSNSIPITVEPVQSACDHNVATTINKQKSPTKKILNYEQYKARKASILSPTKASETPPSIPISQMTYKMIVRSDSKTNKKFCFPAVDNITTSAGSQHSLVYLKEATTSEPVTSSQSIEECRGVSNVISIFNSSNQTFQPSSSTDKDCISKDKQKLGRGALVVCQHCGIENETTDKCSDCKRPLKKISVNTRKLSACDAIKPNIQSSDVATTNHVETPVLKQDFYGKGIVTKVVPTDKKLSFHSYSNRGKNSRGRGRTKLRTYEEPEILTLSSDDDDDNQSKSSSTSSSANFADRMLNVKDISAPMSEQISSKEPNMASDMEDLLDSVANISIIQGSDIQNIASHMSIECRSIRIGSYKILPKKAETLEIVKDDHISFNVPCPIEGDSKMIPITIKFIHMTRILFHRGPALPVIFIYLRPSEAKNIRKLLQMNNETQFNFDPTSKEQCQRRITILPKKLDEDMKTMIKYYLDVSTFNSVTAVTTKLTLEITQEDANEILVKSSLPEAKALVKKMSLQQTETKTYLIYPPPPSKGGITITEDDYICLEEEQFLNDVILDFYLKWLLMNKLTQENVERTHIFSTFFYKRLTSKPKKVRTANSSEDDPTLTAVEKRHARVKSWTKNVDIFEKDFVVVPINEHSHWFLAVICFPGLNGPVSVNDGQPVQTGVDQDLSHKIKTKAKIEIPVIDEVEWSDRDEAEGDDDELDYEEDEEDKEKDQRKINSSKEGETGSVMDNATQNKFLTNVDSTKVEAANQETLLKEKINKTKEDPSCAIKQPCILIFDSLSGANRCRIVATLRDYLSVEYQRKRKVKKIFSRFTMKGACPKVPQQTNHTDCGIFTLQFAESFFQNPIKNFRIPIRTLTNWFPQDVVARKREEIANLIKSLMDEHKPHHGITLRSIKFNSHLNKNEMPEGQSNEQMTENFSSVSVGEQQNSSVRPADSWVSVKRKHENDESGSTEYERSVIKANDGHPCKSQKFSISRPILEQKGGTLKTEVLKVLPSAGNIIIHKTNINQSNMATTISKGNNSPVTNICESKPVRIAIVSSRPHTEYSRSSEVFINTNRMEPVVAKPVNDSNCGNIVGKNGDSKPHRRYEIRDDETKEVLLIVNEESIPPSTTDGIAESNIVSSGVNELQISTACLGDTDCSNASNIQTQETNTVSLTVVPFSLCPVTSATSLSYHAVDQTKVNTPTGPSEVAFDKLLQSSTHTSVPSSETSMIIDSESKLIRGSSSFIKINPNDSQHKYSRAPTVSVGSRQSSTLSNSKAVTVPLSTIHRPMQTIHSNNLSTISNMHAPISLQNTHAENLLPSTTGRLSTVPDVSQGSAISKVRKTYSNTSTYTSTSATISRTPSKSHFSTFAPSLTQPSFNVTHQDSNALSDSEHNKKLADPSPLNKTAKFSSNSTVNSGFSSASQNCSVSKISNWSNTVSVLSRPKYLTITQPSMSQKKPLNKSHSTHADITLKSSETMLVSVPSLMPTTSKPTNSINSPSSTDETYNIKVTSPSSISNSNLFSSANYLQSKNTGSENCSDVLHGPFSQSNNVSYDQFNSSDSQRLSDSALLLGFANSRISPPANFASSAGSSLSTSISASNSSSTNPSQLLNSEQHVSIPNLHENKSNSVTSQTEHVSSSMYQSYACSQTETVYLPSSSTSQSDLVNNPTLSSSLSISSKCQSENVNPLLSSASSPNVPLSDHSRVSLISAPQAVSSTLWAESANKYKSSLSHISMSTKGPKLPRTPRTAAPSSILSSHTGSLIKSKLSLMESNCQLTSNALDSLPTTGSVSSSSGQEAFVSSKVTSNANSISDYSIPSSRPMTSQPCNSTVQPSITSLSSNKTTLTSSSVDTLSWSNKNACIPRLYPSHRPSHISKNESNKESNSNFESSLATATPSTAFQDSFNFSTSSSFPLSTSLSSSSSSYISSPSDQSFIKKDIDSNEQSPLLANALAVSGHSSCSTAYSLAYSQPQYSSSESSSISGPSLFSNAPASIRSPILTSFVNQDSLQHSHPISSPVSPIKSDIGSRLSQSPTKTDISVHASQSVNRINSAASPVSSPFKTSTSVSSILHSSLESRVVASSAIQSSPKSNQSASPTKESSLLPAASVSFAHSNNDSNSLISPVENPLIQNSAESSLYPMSVVKQYYSKESPPQSPAFTAFSSKYINAAPPSPPIYMPATRTSSGRNVSIPKRFLDSEQEPYFQCKKKEKILAVRGSRSAKKAKKSGL